MVTSLIAFFMSVAGKYIALALAAFVAFGAAARAVRKSAIKDERIKGLSEQLDMSRKGQAIARKNAALSDEEARAKAARHLQ